MDRSDDSGDGAGEQRTAGSRAPECVPSPLPAAYYRVAEPRRFPAPSVAHTLPPREPQQALPPVMPLRSAPATVDLAALWAAETQWRAQTAHGMEVEAAVEPGPEAIPAAVVAYAAHEPPMPVAAMPAPSLFRDPTAATAMNAPPFPTAAQPRPAPAPVMFDRHELPVAAMPAPPIAPAFDAALRAEPIRRPADISADVRSQPVLPRIMRLAAKAAKVAGYAFAGYMALVLALIVLYRFVNPPTSSLMLQQRLSGTDVIQDWVAMDAISPQIVRAVLLSEDGRFCQHHGIDLQEMQAAIERASDGIPRGASTISMQVAKNLFLWPSKSYVRKAIEIPLTLAIEFLWSKRRIMEVYLNIAEWGPGIFGVEAASRFHFDKAASRLNEREAAQLAVALPNPYSRDAGEPGPGTRRLASDIQDRMRGASPSQTICVLGSRRGG